MSGQDASEACGASDAAAGMWCRLLVCEQAADNSWSRLFMCPAKSERLKTKGHMKVLKVLTATHDCRTRHFIGA
jgi:hypothetical protein